MPITYDSSFNKNEWFILISLIIGLTLVLIYRKRFSTKEFIIYLLIGVLSGLFFDKSLSLEPLEFYDVNDSSAYEFMDFLSYLSYGPFSYFFIYIYDYLKVKLSYTPIYILMWTIISLGIEYLAHSLGVYHYKNGYIFLYGFPIYLIVLSLQIYVYKHISGQRVLAADEGRGTNGY